MEPLFNEDTEGSSNECNKQTQYPKGIDSGGDSRCLEKWDIENWDSRVDKVPIDREVGCLIDELNEENIGKVFRLLLQVLVGFDNERSDDCGK